MMFVFSSNENTPCLIQYFRPHLSWPSHMTRTSCPRDMRQSQRKELSSSIPTSELVWFCFAFARVISDSTLSYSRDIMVPDFSESNSNAAMAALKLKCDSARVLGVVDVSQHERSVIYDGKRFTLPSLLHAVSDGIHRAWLLRRHIRETYAEL